MDKLLNERVRHRNEKNNISNNASSDSAPAEKKHVKAVVVSRDDSIQALVDSVKRKSMGDGQVGKRRKV